MATRPTSAIGDGATTIIGESVQIRGTLSGDEDLHVLGRVDGRIELQRTLVVAQSGIVKAEVSVKNAIISGVVVGNVRASESIEITKEGRMVGDVFAPRVIIVDGASFRGNVDMGDVANTPARKLDSERPRLMPTARPTAPAPSAKTYIPAPLIRPSSSTDRPPERAPERLPERAPDRAPERAPDRAPERAPDRAHERAVERTPESTPPRPAADVPLEPPDAKGLMQKHNKTRVIVKRK